MEISGFMLAADLDLSLSTESPVSVDSPYIKNKSFVALFSAVPFFFPTDQGVCGIKGSVQLSIGFTDKKRIHHLCALGCSYCMYVDVCLF